jgi:hypothetical protein
LRRVLPHRLSDRREKLHPSRGSARSECLAARSQCDASPRRCDSGEEERLSWSGQSATPSYEGGRSRCHAGGGRLDRSHGELEPVHLGAFLPRDRGCRLISGGNASMAWGSAWRAPEKRAPCRSNGAAWLQNSSATRSNPPDQRQNAPASRENGPAMCLNPCAAALDERADACRRPVAREGASAPRKLTGHLCDGPPRARCPRPLHPRRPPVHSPAGLALPSPSTLRRRS